MPSPKPCAFLLPKTQSTLHKHFCQDLKALPNRARGHFLNGKKKKAVCSQDERTRDCRWMYIITFHLAKDLECCWLWFVSASGPRRQGGWSPTVLGTVPGERNHQWPECKMWKIGGGGVENESRRLIVWQSQDWALEDIGHYRDWLLA